MKRITLAALLALLMQPALPAAARAAETFICQLTPYGRGNWIPDVLFIGRTGAAVVVSDPVVLHFNGAPLSGRVAAENARRVTFVWRYAVRDRRGNRAAQMIYRATYLKGSGEMRISATPAGHVERFHGRGRCLRDTR